jgi:phage terminase large subunit-like protein
LIAAYGQVRASRGKRVRAKPIAALFGQGRAHALGALIELQDQMCW